MAIGISTSFAMVLINKVFPLPVGPNNITFDFSSNDGGFRCVHVRSTSYPHPPLETIRDFVFDCDGE